MKKKIEFSILLFYFYSAYRVSLFHFSEEAPAPDETAPDEPAPAEPAPDEKPPGNTTSSP